MPQINSTELLDGKYGITDLIEIDRLREIFEKFHQITGFTIGFLDHPGLNLLVATGWRDICTKFHRGCLASEEICTKSNHHLMDALKEPGKVIIENCENGMVDCAVPIIIKGKHVASLATGQLFLEPPDIRRFKQQAKKFGYNEKEYLEALTKIPVVSKEELKRVTIFLGEIASVISEIGYANLVIKEESKKLEAEISEREKIEKELRESEEWNKTIIQAVLAGVFVIDESDRKIVQVNEAALKFLNLKEEQVLGQVCHNFVCPSEKNNCPILDCGQKIDSSEKILLTANGERKNIIKSVIQVTLHGHGYLIESFIDITERKQMEEALRESELRYSTLFEHASEGILVVDAETKLIVFANPSICKMLGYSADALKSFSIQKIHPEEYINDIQKEFDALELNKKILVAGTPCLRKDGSIIYVNISACRMVFDKKVCNVGFFSDITELRKAEEALRKSEKRVRNRLDAILSPEAAIDQLELADIIDADKIQKLMDKFYQLTNIGMAIIDLQGKVLVGTGWQDICTRFHRVNPESCRLCIESDLELSRDLRPGTFKQYHCKNHMWDIASPIMLGGVLMGNFFLGQFFYEDEVPDYQIFRQQARQYGYNEDEYMAALERVPRWSREKVETVMGFYTSFAEMIGNLSYANVKLANTLEERKRAEEEIRTLNQELEKRVIERTIELENTNANLQKEIEIRKTAEEQIKNQLLEKEVLLKEIHHRVKNNMQIIISILNLQVSFVKSGKIVEIIHDSQRRIKTMALIHEKLYQSKNIADINFSEYIRNLCDYLFSSYMSHETKVGYLIDSENINLDIDKTISLGLITNELVTNSFKYAFEEGKKGIVKIQLKKKDEKTLQFCISDNGKGFPENFDYRNTKSLGLQLVCILTEQIEGKLKVKSSATGTSFSISFPY